MRCQPDLGKDISAERGRGDAARAQPVPAFGRARHRAIAAEDELAHARALRSLKDDAAQGVGKARMADAVDHRLRDAAHPELRSEEHTSELQSLMRISYAVFCLKK